MAKSDMIGDIVNRFENVEDGRIFSEDEEDEPHVVIRYVQKVCSICKEKYVDGDGYESGSEGVKYVMADVGSNDTAKKSKKKDSGKTKSSGKGKENDSKKKDDSKKDKVGKAKNSDVDEACVEHRKRDQVVKSKLTKQQSDAIEESLKEQVKTRDQQKMVLVQQPAGQVQVKRAKRDRGSQEDKENEEGKDDSDHVGGNDDHVDARNQHEYSSVKRSDGDGEEDTKDTRRQNDRSERIKDSDDVDGKKKERFRDQDKKEDGGDEVHNRRSSQEEEDQKKHKRNKSETKSYDSSTDRDRQSIRGDQEDDETRKSIRRNNDNDDEGGNGERARRGSNESGALERNDDGDDYKDEDGEQKSQSRDYAHRRQKNTESKEGYNRNEEKESDERAKYKHHSRNSSTVQDREESDQERRSKINSEQDEEESKHEDSNNRVSEQDKEDSRYEQSKYTDSEHGGESKYESSKNKDSELDEESGLHRVEKREESKVLAKRQESGKDTDEDDKTVSGKRGSNHSYRENDSETGETREVKERTHDELQDDIVNQETAVDDGLAGIESGKTGKMVTRYIYHNVDEPRHTGNSIAEEDKHDPHALNMSVTAEVNDIEALTQALGDVRNDGGEGVNRKSWVLVGHVNNNPNQIQLVGQDTSGEANIDDFATKLEDDQVMYGFIRMSATVDMNTTVKFVYVHWHGENVPFARKGRFGVVHGSIVQHFHPFHLQIETGNREDLTEDEITKRLDESSFSTNRILSSGDVEGRQHRGFTQHQVPRSTSGTVHSLAPAGASVNIDPEVNESIGGVRDDKNALTWIVAGFEDGDPKKQLVVMAKGEGDIEELKESLKDDQVQYALYRTSDIIDAITTVKFVYIYWIGEDVKALVKGKVSAYAGPVEKVFSPAHVTLSFSNKGEMDESVIRDKVMAGSGSKSFVK